MQDFLAGIGGLYLVFSAFAFVPYLTKPRALLDDDPLHSEYVRFLGIAGLLVWFITGMMLCAWLVSLAFTLPLAGMATSTTMSRSTVLGLLLAGAVCLLIRTLRRRRPPLRHARALGVVAFLFIVVLWIAMKEAQRTDRMQRDAALARAAAAQGIMSPAQFDSAQGAPSLERVAR